jgi:hypothetical protein
MYDLRPDMVAAILKAFRTIRESLDDAEIAKLVATGALDQIVRDVVSDTLLDRSLLPVRYRIRQTVERGFRYAVPDLPAAGKIDGVISVAFDHLSPNVITAVRTLETSALDTLKSDVKEVVRAFVENGLRDGKAPKVIARGLRDVIGLAPNQERYVANLRAELEEGRFADAARRQLIDKRFNLAKLDALSPAARAKRVDTVVESYRKSYIAFNADVNTKTAVFDSYKLGQRLAFEDAAAQGIVDRDRLTKRWVGVMDEKERPEHVAMQNQTVAFDDLFSNGENIPGDSTFNCRCIAVYSQSRA